MQNYSSEQRQSISHYPTTQPNSMAQMSSWEANRFSVSQEIPRILWSPRVRYGIHKNTPPVPILRQTNQVYAPFPPLKIYFDIIFHLRLGLPSCVVIFPVCTSPVLHACYTPPSIQFFLIWLHESRLVRITSHQCTAHTHNYNWNNSLFYQLDA